MSSNIKVGRICQTCGKLFTARTTVTKCCSDRCSKIAYKKRIKEEKVAASIQETEEKISKSIKILKNKDFLSLEEAAKVLNLSRTSIYRLRKEGGIQFVLRGKKKLIPKKAIDQFLNPEI